MPIATPPADFDPTLAPPTGGQPTEAEARAAGFDDLPDLDPEFGNVGTMRLPSTSRFQ